MTLDDFLITWNVHEFWNDSFEDMIRKDYDGRPFDLTEYVGEWAGYEVYLGYTKSEEYIMLAKGKKSWYASKDDCREIKYIFDL